MEIWSGGVWADSLNLNNGAGFSPSGALLARSLILSGFGGYGITSAGDATVTSLSIAGTGGYGITAAGALTASSLSIVVTLLKLYSLLFIE